jgi:hypothetical protein
VSILWIISTFLSLLLFGACVIWFMATRTGRVTKVFVPTSCDHSLKFVRINGCLSNPYFDAELMLIRGADKMHISDAVVDVDDKDMERAELARAGLGRLYAGR